MKIAIFGDSFGDDHINWKDKNKWLDVGPSWIDYLRQFHEVDNFCSLGSSLYFSKKKFDSVDLSTYDQVIFLITSPQRRLQFFPGDGPLGSNWNSIIVDLQLKNKTFPELKKHLTALDMFFKYIYNESDEYFHQLMVDDIKRNVPSGIVIDVSARTVVGEIGQTELEYFNSLPVNEILAKGLEDARKCHMCEENNLIFGKYIHFCLLHKIHPQFSKDMFVNPSRPFEYYFRKS
jgi:hypothetical protein